MFFNNEINLNIFNDRKGLIMNSVLAGKKIGVFGYGTIGKRLVGKLTAMGANVRFIVRSNQIYDAKMKEIGKTKDYLSICEKENVELVFLAISNSDPKSTIPGTIAFNYIKSILNKNIRVVTCEKGSLSNYYNELKPCLP